MGRDFLYEDLSKTVRASARISEGGETILFACYPPPSNIHSDQTIGGWVSHAHYHKLIKNAYVHVRILYWTGKLIIIWILVLERKFSIDHIESIAINWLHIV